ncbi:sodium-dependent phosphate transport protein 4-like [Schistocerca piceifrons]|uniref:sodium-dependent phosphate transport protein 4-like n=1 Tax=Schistocerca piceifrons TaxID=274613 RepID=UPI001F5FDA99|nr:sodium-dependent phosphate transport protein 4-like [Schistocerca piceifrons]
MVYGICLLIISINIHKYYCICLISVYSHDWFWIFSHTQLKFMWLLSFCSSNYPVPKESKIGNPWPMVLSNPPMWAHCFVMFGIGWVNYTLLSELPTYMEKILHYDLDQAGLVSALPYLFGWISCSIYGYLTRKCTQKGVRIITTMRVWDAVVFASLQCSILSGKLCLKTHCEASVFAWCHMCILLIDFVRSTYNIFHTPVQQRFSQALVFYCGPNMSTTNSKQTAIE